MRISSGKGERVDVGIDPYGGNEGAIKNVGAAISRPRAIRESPLRSNWEIATGGKAAFAMTLLKAGIVNSQLSIVN